MASSDPVSGVRMRGVMLPATEGNRERYRGGGGGGKKEEGEWDG